MSRLNLDNDDVQVVELSVEQVRNLVGSTEEWIGDDVLDTALDVAQGDVFSGRRKARYVVIIVGV
jgi:hypothetical protein